ncbi:SACOL1771 family peroxiredoxin [Paludifilum halophilum]|uniref:Peroxiredoxin n=1 Tax=Paludifilum halophilum TaxID=1642702 RepID=A0A235B5P7_9BACL|nr:SACOL1771 family peroxiredoxin [Paludifilum halophilum]OYD07299.1 hypothetical protein CHM34_12085 [Paludifilum halophilum]
MPRHEFHLTAEWNGGRNGEGKISAGHLNTQISIPEEMDGPGIGTNPDEMLIGAAATCYIITLAAMIERKGIPLSSLSLKTVGGVREDRGLKFESITHKPVVVLDAAATEEQVKYVEGAAERAEQTCMISNALRGNVRLEVEATVTVAR